MMVLIGLLYVMMYATPLGLPIKQKNQANTKTIYFIAYIVASLLFTFGGLVVLSRILAAAPALGTNYDIYFILVLFLCGGSIYFEKKPLLPIILFVSCLIFTMLGNLLALFALSADMQYIVYGGLLIVILPTSGSLGSIRWAESSMSQGLSSLIPP
jgi:ribose/xylose/arabinose/galactoside ABC-type transport system permease subunit